MAALTLSGRPRPVLACLPSRHADCLLSVRKLAPWLLICRRSGAAAGGSERRRWAAAEQCWRHSEALGSGARLDHHPNEHHVRHNATMGRAKQCAGWADLGRRQREEGGRQAAASSCRVGCRRCKRSGDWQPRHSLLSAPAGTPPLPLRQHADFAGSPPHPPHPTHTHNNCWRTGHQTCSTQKSRVHYKQA